MGLDDLHEAAPDIGIAGHGPGPQQRLPLPHERPSGVVRPIALEAPSEGPLLAFGAEPEVDGVDGRRLAAEELEQPLGGLLGGREVGGRRTFVDEQQIEITRVGELGAPEPAHGHRRERHRRIDGLEGGRE